MYRSCKYLTLPIFYVYKRQIKTKMECGCHIWAWDAKTSLSRLVRVKNRVRAFVGYELFSTLQPISKSGMCHVPCCFIANSRESSRTNFVLPRKNFMARTRYAIYVVAHHPHSIYIPLVRSSNPAASLREPLPRVMFSRSLQSWTIHATSSGTESCKVWRLLKKKKTEYRKRNEVCNKDFRWHWRFFSVMLVYIFKQEWSV